MIPDVHLKPEMFKCADELIKKGKYEMIFEVKVLYCDYSNEYDKIAVYICC